MLAFLLASLCAAGCSDPVEPVGGMRAPSPQAGPAIPTDSACRALTITLVGNNGLTVAFPNRATCPAGLIVIPGGIASRGGARKRTVSIPIRLLNRTGYTVQLPALVVLAPESKVVLEPRSEPPSKIVPQTPDSTRGETGESVWFVGSSGTLSLNDSSVSRTLRVRLESAVTSALVTFSLEGTQVTAQGWPILTTELPVLDGSKLIAKPGTNIIYFRTAAIIEFVPGTATATKQAFFAQHRMTVLGVDAAGEFFVTIPDPGTSITTFESYFEQLRQDPGILRARPAFHTGIRGDPITKRSRSK